MAIEIERKFLLKNDDWRTSVIKSFVIKQGYLQSGVEATHKSSVRIRISDQQANINIKSVGLAMVRQEYEYTIPIDDANEMLNNLCSDSIIEKTRYHVWHKSQNNVSHLWEIDVFDNENFGLQVAEIELSQVNETFNLPKWVGEEVTEDMRYYNHYLAECPYRHW